MTLDSNRGVGRANMQSETKPELISKYYLLVIGIDFYPNGFKKLNNAVLDAASMADFLTERYLFDRPTLVKDLRETDPDHYPKSQFAKSIPIYNGPYTTCLYNEAATRSEILYKLDQFSGATGNSALGENDALLIYFAGHGIYHTQNKNYYLIAYDSVPGRTGDYISIADIASRFHDYLGTKCCKNLLLVLDSCYAGGGQSGFTSSNASSGNFSRRVLTSCSSVQPAADGTIGRGSTFANAFKQSLEQNPAVYPVISDVIKFLQSKLIINAERKEDPQQIQYELLPNAFSGKGEFAFEKRDKIIEDIYYLKESFIEYLDFHNQRGDLLNGYDQTIDHLNVITTQGYSFEVQKVLSKIIFRFINNIILLKPAECWVAEPIRIDKTGDNDIWRSLYRQIKDEKGTMKDDNTTIFQWYFEKLRSDKEDVKSDRHVILWISFALGGENIFERVAKFCKEFSVLFMQHFRSLTNAEKLTYGKMFVLISDERETGTGLERARFMDIINSREYNMILTNEISRININYAVEWRKKFVAQSPSPKIKDLGNDAVWADFIGNNKFLCSYEEFIQKICVHCQFDQDMIMQLHTQLYSFNNKFLI